MTTTTTTTITVVGGTGYAGSAIVREAASRGHDVIAISRSLPEPEARVAGVRYEQGTALDADVRTRAVSGSDVVVSALSPRGELDGRIVEADTALATLAAEHGVRVGVIGGFSSLRPAPDAPRSVETDEVPEQFASEARQMNDVLSALLAMPADVDWFFVSPAMQFGSHAPGEALGHHRVGGEVALYDDNGVSAVSGADFAVAVVDEIEQQAHRREHISVAY